VVRTPLLERKKTGSDEPHLDILHEWLVSAQQSVVLRKDDGLIFSVIY